MRSKRFLISILIIASACLRGTHSLDYSDIEAIGVACPSRDSCASYSSTASFGDRNCECDANCHRYDDCCIDANRPSRGGNRSTLLNRACLRFGGHLHTGVYVINTCKPNWSGPEVVRRKCHGQVDFSDPLKAVPVISTSPGVTYRNTYCAECNDASPSSLTSFQILLNCEGITQSNMTDYIWNNIEYDSSSGEWGMNRWNSTLNQTEFVTCEVLFDLPEYATNRVRMCRANLTSTCPRNWNRPQVRRACESYMAIVYGSNNKVYRNPHCALCNYLSVNRFACDQGILGRAKRPFTFADMLDINPSDGDRVGVSRQVTPSCSSGQVYNPFLRSCQSRVCAVPGYVLVNGRCRPP